jgi:mannose-6-phosphate isomerase-like protein (cupin superfamily)
VLDGNPMAEARVPLKRDRGAPPPYETITVGDHTVRFVVHSDESGGSASVFEASFPAGTGIPAAHSHDGFDESYVGVAGTMTVTVDGSTEVIEAGEAVFVPRGAVHEFFNHGSEEARILVIASPGPAHAEDYIRELAQIFATAGADGPDPALLAAAMERHGYRPAAPGG